MTHANLIKAKADAIRFLAKVNELERSDHDFITGTKHTSAVKRASMDLTRALAELRKPN